MAVKVYDKDDNKYSKCTCGMEMPAKLRTGTTDVLDFECANCGKTFTYTMPPPPKETKEKK